MITLQKIAARNHYPAIDVLGSVSRLMTDIVDRDQIDIASQIRNMMSVYDTNFDLVNIGAYKNGSNPGLDKALKKIDGINGFLQQKVDEKICYQDSIELMKRAIL